MSLAEGVPPASEPEPGPEPEPASEPQPAPAVADVSKAREQARERARKRAAEKAAAKAAESTQAGVTGALAAGDSTEAEVPTDAESAAVATVVPPAPDPVVGEPESTDASAKEQEPAEEAPADEVAVPELPFCGSGGDSEAVAKVKAALRASEDAQDCLQEGLALTHTAEGRDALANAGASAHGTVCMLDSTMFNNLVSMLEACFASAFEEKDFGQLAAFVGMLDKYAKSDDGTEDSAFILSNDERIRSAKLWADVDFWSEAVISMLAGANPQVADASPTEDLSAEEIQFMQAEQRKNLAFHYVINAVKKLLEFGNVAVPDVDAFVITMKEMELVTDNQLLKLIDDVLGQCEYDRLVAQLDQPVSESQEHDDLGFLVENQQRHDDFVKYQSVHGGNLEQQRAAWSEWLAAEPSGDSAEVKARLQAGVPMEQRAVVYEKLLAASIQELKVDSGTTYAALISEAEEQFTASESVPGDAEPSPLASALEMIEKDLDRTFPGHTYFETAEGVQALRNVLRAYAAYNPEVGYCQSMNYIAAVMLLAMGTETKEQEEQAFWLFVHVEKKIPAFHERTLVGSRVDARTLFSLAQKYLPKLFIHLEANNVIPEISFISWFMCLFLNALPVRTTLRVWDCLVVGDRNVLMRISLAVLAKCERLLLAAPTPFEMNRALQEAPLRIFDADGLLASAFKADWCTDDEIQQLRQNHEEDIAEEEDQLNERRKQGADENSLKKRLVAGHADKNESVEENLGGIVVRLSNGELLRGTLFITSYRVAIVSRSPNYTDDVSVPLLAIHEVNKQDKGSALQDGTAFNVPQLELTTKCGRSIQLLYSKLLAALLTRLEQCEEKEIPIESDPQVSRLRQKARAAISKPASQRAHTKIEELRAKIDAQMAKKGETNDSPFLRHVEPAADGKVYEPYDPIAEYTRQGVGSENSTWRISEANKNYELCKTYSSVLVAPKEVTDEQLHRVAEFRSKQRLPVLSWIDSESQTAIVRCAQPLVGISGKKSEEDEELFDEIIKANPNKCGISMLDARPLANAIANKGKGGGYENASRYDDGAATLLFLNIDNIHVMRKSLLQMHTIMNSSAGPIRRIEYQTGWILYTSRVLGGARTIVKEVADKKRSALVHCSDGWDRTAQLCALSEMCLDPYYRTLQGFRIVCQREWQSFGHKFRDRLWSHRDHMKERSPVFFQFLDCVHQLLHEYPTAFEFKMELLLFIIDSMYSMEYSDFRYNCERERMEHEREAGAEPSLWQDVDGKYVNPDYVHNPEVILPPMRARVWTEFFNRWATNPVTGRGGGTVWSLDSMLSDSSASADILRPPPIFMDQPPVHEGWIFHKPGSDKPRLRWLTLFPTIEGEACLVYFKQEKSQSVVCETEKEVIPLVDGHFKVLTMPQRTAADKAGKYWFQVQHSAKRPQPSAIDEASTLKSVARGTREVVAQIRLSEGQQARWQASLQQFDVKFQLMFEEGPETRPPEPIGEQLQEGMIGDPTNKDAGGRVKGTFTAPSDGCFKLVLDNSYSKMRSKDVSFFLGTEEKALHFETVVKQEVVAPNDSMEVEKQTLFADNEAEGLAWLKALQGVSGQQTETEVASDDDDGQSKGASLRKMAGRFTDEVASVGLAAAADGRLLPPKDHELDLTIKARSKEPLVIALEAGQSVHWKLQIESYDIKWCAIFQPSGVQEGQVGAAPLEHVYPPELDRMADLMEVEGSVGQELGQYTTQVAGELRLIMDNSYSKLRKKVVRCGFYADGEGAAMACSFIPRKHALVVNGNKFGKGFELKRKKGRSSTLSS